MTNQETIIRKLHQKFKEGIDELFIELDQILIQNTKNNKDFLLFQHRYNRIENHRQKGIISDQDYYLKLNRISEGMLLFIDRIKVLDIIPEFVETPSEVSPQIEKPTIFIQGKNIIHDSKIEVKGNFRQGDHS